MPMISIGGDGSRALRRRAGGSGSAADRRAGGGTPKGIRTPDLHLERVAS
jgi:hypothetical protein